MVASTIVDYKLYIRTLRGKKLYIAEFTCDDGRKIQRQVTHRGIVIPASETAVVVDGADGLEIQNEDGRIVSRVLTSLPMLTASLQERGEFHASQNIRFSAAMEEYVRWHNGKRKDPKIAIKASHSVRRFGDSLLSDIKRKSVKEWIEELEEQYADKTISHLVGVARSMVEWLVKEERWSGPNPFKGHEWQSDKKGRAIKAVISEEEFINLPAVTGSPQLIQAAHIGYYTGIRPEEISASRPMISI